MKSFLGTLFICLVIVEVFFFFGGGLLFDLSRHYYGAGAVTALIIAVLISAWMRQEERLDALEKRIKELENTEDSNNKENEQ